MLKLRTYYLVRFWYCLINKLGLVFFNYKFILVHSCSDVHGGRMRILSPPYTGTRSLFLLLVSFYFFLFYFVPESSELYTSNGLFLLGRLEYVFMKE